MRVTSEGERQKDGENAEAAVTDMTKILARLDEINERLRRIEIEKADDDAMLSVAEVATLTTLSEREIYRQVKERTFPAPVPLAGRRKAWTKGVVLKWNRQRRVKAS